MITIAVLLVMLAAATLILTVNAFTPVRKWLLVVATILAGVVAVLALTRVLT